jgi:hypothetical protein
MSSAGTLSIPLGSSPVAGVLLTLAVLEPKLLPALPPVALTFGGVFLLVPPRELLKLLFAGPVLTPLR